MTRENVEYWLLHEMHKRAQDVDAGLIRQALARIAPVTEEDAEKAHLSLLTFHWEHDAQIAVRRRRRRQTRAAALVLVLLTLMTAAGFTLGVNIWRVAYEWAAEQLLMQLRPNEGATLPDAGASGLEYIADVWGDAVYEMMMENDIHVSLPAWKPEGFIWRACMICVLMEAIRSCSHLCIEIQKGDICNYPFGMWKMLTCWSFGKETLRQMKRSKR